jgi:hypothetical protein
MPPTRIRPEIGKLPKETVARIPLVLYIPHPDSAWISKSQTEAKHSYPPKEMSFTASRLDNDLQSRQRPKWLSFRTHSAKKQVDEWEAQWVAGTSAFNDVIIFLTSSGIHPFVRLTGSRATCSVCLEEFQEPQRRSVEMNRKNGDMKSETAAKVSGDEGTTRISSLTWLSKLRSPHVAEDRLKLKSAGDGAQPLRLLACGHVFHVGRLILSDFTGLNHNIAHLHRSLAN